MKFCVDRNFIYIIARDDEHKEQLQSYYKITKEELEEITKDWSTGLLIPIEPTNMSDLDSLETTHKECDTPGPNIMKKTKEVQDLSSASRNISSVSPNQGGDDEVEELNRKGVEQKPEEVTPPIDDFDPLKKRKVSPLKPSPQKKLKSTVIKMNTVITADDFDFIIVALNDASLEIMEK